MSDASGSALLDPRAARRALQNARGKQKLDLILSAPDPQQLVSSLPPEELYFALLDIGPDDAAELVAMASPEQFRHFVDMSAWRGTDEGPRTSQVVRWLSLAREGGEDLEKFRRQLWSLDIELLALVLRRELLVHDLTEEEPSLPQNPGMAYYTPDRRFLLEFAGSGEYAAVRQLIEDLYAQDPFGAGRLIESIRWELPIELEETARRWRDGRLRDAGVPEFEEAVSFYARPAQRESEAYGVPGTQALTAPGGPLLDAALERLDGDDLESAEEAIVYAANAALVANRVPLDDADEVRERLGEARATLALLSARELSPARLGPKAEEAGLGPAVVKASLALRALIASQARGEPFLLRGAADESPEKPAGFEEKVEQLLRSSVHDDAGRRAADRLRSRLT